MKNIEIIYFGSFAIEHVPKKIENFFGDKNIKMFRKQAHNSIVSGYFCIGFIEFTGKDCRKDFN